MASFVGADSMLIMRLAQLARTTLWRVLNLALLLVAIAVIFALTPFVALSVGWEELQLWWHSR
jgi:hypothetical protein